MGFTGSPGRASRLFLASRQRSMYLLAGDLSNGREKSRNGTGKKPTRGSASRGSNPGGGKATKE
jgi:hypothetical protein